MGKSSPDYSGAAIAQGEANEGVVRDQTYANRPEQTTPWGQTTWTPQNTVDPSTGDNVTSWSQNQSLTPELQEILDKQIGIQNSRSDVAQGLTDRMNTEFGETMDWSGLNPMGDNITPQLTAAEGVDRNLDFSGAHQIGDPSEIRKGAEDSMYNQAMSRLQPEFEASKEQKEIQLRNRGLQPGDTAYDSEMRNLDMGFNDARNQAMWSASDAGRSEAGQLFGQDVTKRGVDTGEETSKSGFYNQSGDQAFGQALAANRQNFDQGLDSSKYSTAIRQQQMTEEMQKRGFTLNEINALLSGQQVNTPQMPNFVAAGSAQPAPIYQSAVDAGNFKQGTAQNVMDAIGGFGSAAMGFM